MADVYGATQVPLTASSPAGSDPLLTYLASYLQAVGNAYALAEWTNIAPGAAAPSNLPIKATFTDEPIEGGGLNAKDLPALYVYRKDVTARTDVAQSIRVEFGELSVVWVPPHAVQVARRARYQFAAKLFKVFDDYFERGRDPAWVVAADPDPLAAPHMDVGVLSAGSPTIGLTGTPVSAAFDVVVRMTTGGARGTAVFKWSSDGGTTWTLNVTTAATVVLGSTGLTATFAVGTYAIGNQFESIALSYGSLLPTFAKYRRLRLGAMRPSVITIDVETDRPLRYPAFECTATVEEELVTDASARPVRPLATVLETVELPADPTDSLPLPLVLDDSADLSTTPPT